MKPTKSVLIVEDDDAIRAALEVVVESEGYACMSARNGKEALAMLNGPPRADPCVILLDLMMPEMNGWEFLAAKRNLDVIVSIPVVVMSAVADRAVLPKGSVKILRKPMELDNLAQNLKDLCDPDAREKILHSGSVWDQKRVA